jgi:hypothetical protein
MDSSELVMTKRLSRRKRPVDVCHVGAHRATHQRRALPRSGDSLHHDATRRDAGVLHMAAGSGGFDHHRRRHRTCLGRPGAEKFDKTRSPSRTSVRGTGVPTVIRS